MSFADDIELDVVKLEAEYIQIGRHEAYAIGMVLYYRALFDTPCFILMSGHNAKEYARSVHRDYVQHNDDNGLLRLL